MFSCNSRLGYVFDMKLICSLLPAYVYNNQHSDLLKKNQHSDTYYVCLYLELVCFELIMAKVDKLETYIYEYFGAFFIMMKEVIN